MENIFQSQNEESWSLTKYKKKTQIIPADALLMSMICDKLFQQSQSSVCITRQNNNATEIL